MQAAGGAADASTRWGANAVELEVMRYLPRQDLTEALKGYDLIQVIAGGPALAYVTRRLRVPTVLLAASLVDWERVSLLAQLGSRRPLVSTMTHLTTRVERAALRTADKILVMNSTLQARLRSYGHDNVEVAFPGVDVRRFVPHQSGWQRSGPIISVARLAEPRKRLDRTIWAYSLAVAADRNIPSLVLAGKGDLPAGLRALIDQLRLRSRVEVRQDLTAGQLQDLYQTASVFLQTSHEEGFGIAVLEAMASGLPVVATATAGTSETVVPGATGWLIPQMREVQLHRLIAEKLLEVLHGPGEELGKNGRARCIEAYSDEGALAPFIDTYERVRQTTDMRLEGLPSRGRSRFAR
ncbi:MAG: glycosyltransferase family 4 protein [Candidatus Dormibacteria bacterium]